VKLTVRYVGLDVHADSIVVALAEEGRGEAKIVKKLPHDWYLLPAQLRSLSRKGKLMICYAAGPTG
jgi:hypothetical protein